MSAGAAVRVPGRQGSALWLDNRKDVVGSADIPVITGSSPFRSTSIFDLWAVKSRQLDSDEPTRDDETEERREDEERYWFGHALEPVIADRLELVTGWKLRRVNDQLRHPVHGWVGASLDRIVVGQHRIAELKWVPRGGWARGATEGIPDHVQDQIQWQAMVKGWSDMTVAVLDGDRLRIEHARADVGYQDDLLVIAHEKLWRYVLSGDMPPVDGSEATKRALASLANRRALVNGQHLDARRMPEVKELAQEWHRARAERKASAQAEEDVKGRVSALLLAAGMTGADGIGWRIDWHRQTDTTKSLVNHAALSATLRGVIEQLLLVEDPLVRGALRDMDLDPDNPDLFAALEGRHTEDVVTRRGPRVLNLYVKQEEARLWQ